MSEPESTQRVREAREAAHAAEAGDNHKAPPRARSFVDGATFALDAPTKVESVWGAGLRVLWAAGEPLMIAKPDGVGGTTIAQQLALCRAGVRSARLLGFTVAPDPARKVLYLALDRPRQAARSMRRMVTEDDREALRERLVVWAGALPFDLVSEPSRLVEMALQLEATTVVIDCLKDVAPALSEEVTGQAINRALQLCVEASVVTLALHHQRKAQADNKQPRRLADVYGSRWLTAGCGSVLVLWGDAGDPIVELSHLKQPADEVGPLLLLHDNHLGTTTVRGHTDVVDVVARSLTPVSVKDVAAELFKKREPKDNEVEKARRQLEASVKDGDLLRVTAEPGEPVLYRLTDQGSRRGSRGSRGGSRGEGHGSASPPKGVADVSPDLTLDRDDAHVAWAEEIAARNGDLEQADDLGPAVAADDGAMP